MKKSVQIWSYCGAFVVFALLLLVVTTFYISHKYYVWEGPENSESQTRVLNSFGPTEAAVIKSKALEFYGKMPIQFEANQGQLDSQVKFLSHGRGDQSLFLTPTETVITFSNNKQKRRSAKKNTRDVLRMSLVNANENPNIKGLEEQECKVNYYVGNDPSKWRDNIKTYSKVFYEQVYAGIDLVYYGNQNELEYDFIVSPGVDPAQIKLNFEGANKIEIAKNGDLEIKVGQNLLRHASPIIYQESAGERLRVEGKFALDRLGRASFEIGSYDLSLPLVIDPKIVYSSFLGGSGGDIFFSAEGGTSVTVDADGNAYVVGLTPSADFPTANANQTVFAGGPRDAFITKFNPTGTGLIYSTYLGGADDEVASNVSIDETGRAYVTGYTFSTNFPLKNEFSGYKGSADAFIARFNSDGALGYSTYFGGTGPDFGAAVKLISANTLVIVGDTASADLPTVNPIQPTNAGGADAFVSVLNPDANQLSFSTFFGGQFNDEVNGAAFDSGGNVYFTGVTISQNYPVTQGAFQTEANGTDDVFVTKINPNARQLVYSTYLGGNLIDNAGSIAVDSSGNACVTGFTRSSNFPTQNAYQPRLLDPDAFVTKLNPTGTGLVFSTFFGGSDLERSFGVATDSIGNVYITGWTRSGDMPTKRPLQNARGIFDGFVCKFNPSGALVFSTFLGGRSNDQGSAVAADNKNNLYVVGQATAGLPTTPGAFQQTPKNELDGFVAKINTSTKVPRSDFDGDGKSDIAVFRPSQGTWYVLQSTNNTLSAFHFGLNGDIPVPGDYDGDQKTDYAVFRPSTSTWYILNSRNNSFRGIAFGLPTDKPVQGDFDGDDKTDIAVYRPSNSFWYILQSATNTLKTQPFGSGDDKPVQSDYDGDTLTDIAIFSQTNGTWYLLQSFSGFRSQQFGLNADKPVPADYDGDATDDIAVFRNGVWYIMLSSNGTISIMQWGLPTDLPTAADYDGDGKDDIAVYRPNEGVWYVVQSSNGSFIFTQFGLNGDVPIANAYLAN